jgi:RNA-binding protein
LSPLTSKQRAQLRSLAHPLKAVVQVGKEGVTDDVVRTVLEALHNRELIKVKVLEGAPMEAREGAHEVAARVDGSEVVQVIGRTFVLYRRHPDSPELLR